MSYTDSEIDKDGLQDDCNQDSIKQQQNLDAVDQQKDDAEDAELNLGDELGDSNIPAEIMDALHQFDDNADTQEIAEQLTENSKITQQGIFEDVSELRSTHGFDVKQSASKNSILNIVIENIRRHDYVSEMYTLTPELLPQIAAARTLIAEIKTTRPEGWELELEVAKEQYSKLRRSLKIPEEKNQYKIIGIEYIVSVFESIGYPIVWMMGSFYVWNGIYFSIITDRCVIESFLREAGLKSGIPKYIIKNADFLVKMMEQLISFTTAVKSEEKRKAVQVNFLNGTLEIDEDGRYRLREHSHNDLFTYALPFNFNPKATSPLWNKHLARVLPDTSVQKLLAEHFGYSFISVYLLKLEKVPVLYGDGANGKSVIFDVINATFGKENVCSNSLESLCNNSGYFRIMLDGKLLNYCSELSSKMNIEQFKRLASIEPIEVRSPYEKPYIMVDYAKLMFNCNDLPRKIEYNHAYYRRLNIIRFDVIIPDEEQDKDLACKIMANELPGVFNWILEGMTRLTRQKKFSHCQSVDDQMKEYKLESDSVQLFMDESGYVSDPNEWIPQDDLYQRYDNYCKTNHYHCCAKNTFTKRLKALGYDVRRTNKQSIVFVRQDGNPSLGL